MFRQADSLSDMDDEFTKGKSNPRRGSPELLKPRPAPPLDMPALVLSLSMIQAQQQTARAAEAHIAAAQATGARAQTAAAAADLAQMLDDTMSLDPRSTSERKFATARRVERTYPSYDNGRLYDRPAEAGSAPPLHLYHAVANVSSLGIRTRDDIDKDEDEDHFDIDGESLSSPRRRGPKSNKLE